MREITHPDAEWFERGPQRIQEVITHLGYPAALYVSAPDWQRVTTFFRIERDERGPYVDLWGTRVRPPRHTSAATLDKTDVADLFALP